MAHVKDKNSNSYLVFDIETVPDAALIRSVRYPDEDINDVEAVERYRADIFTATNGASQFIPATFQLPVALCLARVRGDLTIESIASLDEPDFRTEEISRAFWREVENSHPDTALVTFNGRGFDLPVMELMSFRYGIQARRYFGDRQAGRYRAGVKHIDLQTWLSNYSAVRLNGGLNLLAKAIGCPGKGEVNGDAVYGLYHGGKKQEISDYCIGDVLDTYLVFLRTMVMQGEISPGRESDILSGVREYLSRGREAVPALGAYLDRWTGR